MSDRICGSLNGQRSVRIQAAGVGVLAVALFHDDDEPSQTRLLALRLPRGLTPVPPPRVNSPRLKIPDTALVRYGARLASG